MPRGHEHDPIYSHHYLRALFSSQMIVMKKRKKRCAVFGFNNDRLFPEKYTLKFSFPPEKRV